MTLVAMVYPPTGGTGAATPAAFTETWEPLGWELATSDPVVVTYGVTMRHRGSWENDIPYSPGDVVDHDGVLYVSIATSLNAEPDVSALSWEQIIETDVVSGSDHPDVDHEGLLPLSTVTTAGDLIVGSGSGVVARLGKGSALQGLRVNAAGTALEYATLTTALVSSVNGRVGVVTGLAEDADVVHTTGAENVAGVKTFAASPVVPNDSWTINQTAGLQAALNAKAVDADVVHDTGNETIAGIKTFSSAPVVPDASFTIAKTSGLQTALNLKAADADVVHDTGTETIAGAKTFSSAVRVPSGVFGAVGLQVGAADVGLYRMSDGELAFTTAVGGIVFHTTAEAGSALRRNIGAPSLGGRIYIRDECWVEDDLWADEGVQITSANVPVGATTLASDAAAGASSITVTSVPGSWIVDKTIHLTKTVGTQYDRPRISSIVGSVIGLESPLLYAHSAGAAVAENPWRGAVYPTASWPVPSGIVSIGADLSSAEATALQSQVVLANAAHCRYRHGAADVLPADWVVNAGITTAAGGFALAVSAGVFSLAGDVVRATAQTVTVTTPHATLPRKDIVVFDLDGVASIVAGTPNASPVAPTPSGSQFLLAEIAVAAAAGSIISGNITSKLARPFRFRTFDPSNAGWVFGPADTTGVRTRSYAGSLHIIEGLDAGSFSTLDLNPSGGQVTIGAGGLAVAGTFGANGSAAVGKQTLGAAATDAATTQTLANNLRSALIAIGLGQT